MARDKDTKSRIEIFLETPVVQLNGVSIDVEPSRLAGHVALYLAEATAIKEITLHFQGKTRLPAPSSDAFAMNAAPVTQVFYSHDWSFLEGEKNHSHTLKAGRHLFPFQLTIAGSQPSTIASPVFGGASIAYKLRAEAVKAGFAFHNIQATLPVPIIRSFPSEAIEYQQTVEIENSWAQKIMYSVTLPHKAWAIGDKITTLLRCSPLAKGVSVLSVNSTLVEQTIVTTRLGLSRESSKTIANSRYDIVNGRAVESRVFDQHSHHSKTRPPSPITPPSTSSRHPSHTTDRDHTASSSFSTSTQATAGPSTPTPDSSDLVDPDSSDLVAHITLRIPRSVTPSHGLEPIIVHHRIRWHMLIANPDGHISELRCSLPLHLLDHRLLNESRAYTAPTRRLLLGGPEGPREQEEEAMLLPSYSAHVRDRVANMYLPDAAALRVTNPWLSHGASPTFELNHYFPPSSSGVATPVEQHQPFLGNLPLQPGAGAGTPLDWVNVELLLSLSGGQPLPAWSDSDRTGRSEPASRWSSRPGTRPPSLERAPRSGEHNSNNHATGLSSSSSSTYTHETAGRAMHNLFKPFASAAFHPTSWFHNSNHNHSSASSGDSEHGHTRQNRDTSLPEMVAAQPQSNTPTDTAVLLHRAFTETPDYAVAARGFLGGVPPLTSMEGLPSYEETQRTIDV